MWYFANVTFGVCRHLCEAWSNVPLELEKDCVAVSFDALYGNCRLFAISEFSTVEDFDVRLTVSTQQGHMTYVKVLYHICLYILSTL